MSWNLNFCLSKIASFSPSSPENRRISPSLLFNSLYEPAVSSSADSYSSTPDFATAVASQRFFFSSPGRSNSIIDSFSSSSSIFPDTIPGGGVPVPTYSADPFIDFRASMQEMVDAHRIQDIGENWDFLHQLLMCYISLNPVNTHKFIVAAFADLLVSLMAS